MHSIPLESVGEKAQRLFREALQLLEEKRKSWAEDEEDPTGGMDDPETGGSGEFSRGDEEHQENTRE